jgi:hypothetical protein
MKIKIVFTSETLALAGVQRKRKNKSKLSGGQKNEVFTSNVCYDCHKIRPATQRILSKKER